MPRRQEFICAHCGRRVFSEGGPLAQVRLCRSCFEKARKAAREQEGGEGAGPNAGRRAGSA